MELHLKTDPWPTQRIMDRQGNFTKTYIENIPIPDSGRVTYRDTKLPGLQLRVSDNGTKTFCLRSNVNRKTVRVTLGRFPKLTVEQARKQAKKQLAVIVTGKNPNQVKKAHSAKATTLRQCFDDYKNSRTNIKAATIKSYINTLDQYLSDWLDKPLLSITRDMVEKRHKTIGEKSPSRANTVMRILRALFEYAHGKYEDENGIPIILHNPVKRLTHVKAWHKETRRITYINPRDLPEWFQTVSSTTQWLDSKNAELIRDYLLLILFTGLRRREAAQLRWDWIDLEQKVLTIPETKNGHPHTLPLTSFLMCLLQERHSNGSEYIFPGNGKSGHFEEPKKLIAKIREKTGVDFTLHDLRRTFITIAESLNIRDYTLKRLLNHRSSGDVTDGYIMSDVERLRQPMEDISKQILELTNGTGNTTNDIT